MKGPKALTIVIKLGESSLSTLNALRLNEARSCINMITDENIRNKLYSG